MEPTIIKGIYLFEDLTDEELSKVSRILVTENHPEGTFLFHEGDKGDKFYVIIKGAVRVSQVISGAGEEALTILSKGDYFGEMALIDESPRSADVIVHENSEFLVISKKDFDELLFFDKEIAYKMLWAFVRTLSRRLRDTNDKIKAFLHMAGNF
jgi:CRP/FNR family transcriptional regulator, cyclic AMP receptor protein